MKFLSVCSGIEAASVAWNPLGWEAEALSEIEPFPCQVLKHHYPHVPNLGDMTKFKEWNLGPIDLFCGGTPCQSFSVAGLRKGLDDPRGNLMLTYLAIADKFRPRWLVWENVPGVLSSNGGRDFGSFLGGLGQLGYGFAYRVLDAQYFGVAQRRKRVFVVGYLGDWRPAAAVLFERDSLCGNPAPSREKGKDTSFCLTRGSSQRFDAESETMIPMAVPEVMATLLSSTAGISRPGNAVTEHETYIPMQAIPIDSMNHLGRNSENHSLGDFVPGAPSYTLTKQHSHAVAQPIPFDTTQITSSKNFSKPKTGDPCHPLASGAHAPAIALAENTIGRKPENGGNGDGFTEGGPMYTLNATGVHGVSTKLAVRRLTPVECERLQGFPDHYTDIKPKGKPTPDGPRYKALGNSWAVPVARWIGERIMMVERLKNDIC
jgi:DNA (cytosine-5)-methyltransferase 1